MNAATSTLEGLQSILAQVREVIREEMAAAHSPFLRPREAADLLRVNVQTLDQWKRDHLQQGIHYTLTPGRGKRGEARYNRELLIDWYQNQHDPAAHQRAIAAWNAQRLGNKKLKQVSK